MSDSNKIVVYAALAGNLAIALVKFVAAYITNSSAMFSEAIHSVVDTLNEILLLYGMKKSQQPEGAGVVLGTLDAAHLRQVRRQLPALEHCVL